MYKGSIRKGHVVVVALLLFDRMWERRRNIQVCEGPSAEPFKLVSSIRPQAVEKLVSKNNNEKKHVPQPFPELGSAHRKSNNVSAKNVVFSRDASCFNDLETCWKTLH